MSIQSALVTFVREGRLPYRADRAWNTFARALGSRERFVTCQGLRFRVRRLTSVEVYVTNLVVLREYLEHGLTLYTGVTVVVIGANFGCFAVLAGSLAARVIAVEPDPGNLRLLELNVQLNAVPVTVIQAGIHESAGTIELAVAEAGGGFHTTHPENYVDTRVFSGRTPVPAVTLDAWFGHHQIRRSAFLKIDCEGAEFGAVAATSLEVLRSIEQIALEYHAPSTDARTRDMIERLTTAGLEVVHEDVFQYHHGGHLFLRRHAQ
jgi:FkbM family methyltransferase